jgi:hypothetical protein
MLNKIEATMLDESVRRHGFLSPIFSVVIEHCRTEHHEWFEFAEGVNRLCLRLLWSLQPKRRKNQQLVVSILFARCLSAFQGAILLAERGMILESRYVLRALLETTFALVANASDKDFCENYIHDDDHRLLTLVNACLRLPPEMKRFHKLEEEELERTKERAKRAIEARKSKALKVATIAARAGLMSHYDTIYRILSNAAHASVRDLDYHIIPTPDDEIDKLGWGPQVAKVPDSIMQACDYLLIACRGVLETFQRPELENQFAALHRRFNTLIDKG